MNKLLLLAFLTLLTTPVLAQINQLKKSRVAPLIEQHTIVRDSSYYANFFEKKNLQKLYKENYPSREDVKHDTFNMPIIIPNYTPYMPIWKPDSTIDYQMPIKRYK